MSGKKERIQAVEGRPATPAPSAVDECKGVHYWVKQSYVEMMWKEKHVYM